MNCAESGTSLCNFGVSKQCEFLHNLSHRFAVVEIFTTYKTKEEIHTAEPFFNYYYYLTLTLQNLETIDSSGKLLKHSIN